MHKSTDADLILLVTQEALADGRRALKFIAKTREPHLGLYFMSFDSKPFQGDPQSHFLQLFRDIAHMQWGCSEDWLAGRGAQLCQELLPVELRRRLWALLDSVRTVHILSDEIWIPWELLRLQDPSNPSSPGRFLVEAFSVARWLLESPLTLSLPMRKIAMVIPKDSNLEKCLAEGNQLKALSGEAREVIEVPALYQEVKDALASGTYDGWHFAGHGLALGDSPHGWGLVLEREQALRPAELYGFADQLGSKRPLIFLNACHSGRGAPSLTGLVGWASTFLNVGAGAFLGSHWAVVDDHAFCFAEEFYRQLFLGLEIGEAVRKARSRLRREFPGNSDWLAYTVFAHPLARCCAPVARRPRAPRVRPENRNENEKVVTRPTVLTAEARTRNAFVEDMKLKSPETETPIEPAPGETRIHEKDGTVLIYVPGGELILGDESIHPWSKPLRRVRLSPFWIARFLVTNEQYSRFLEENPNSRKPAFWEDTRFNQPTHPVVGLSWGDAQAYCRWAGLELPSEAQWEAAARGKDQRPYPWGRELPTPRHGNFGGASGGTTPVGAYPAGTGPYGTLDQAGNVWEWCADSWASNAYQHFEDGQQDPVTRGELAVRSLRGGSWMNPPQDLHAAYRDRGTAKLRFNNQGFRCVWRPA
jgi:formylglycine-generating enzyme required for sulfatase activity